MPGVDFDAVPLGVREDGSPFVVRVRGSHLLCVGATGSGKGSFIQGLIRQLASAVPCGLVRLVGVDPKGGMELAAASPLFDTFAYDVEAACEALEAARDEMKARAARLRGVTRLHTPTPDEPLIVLLLDELAELTAYVTDRDLRKRIDSALAVLLSQGRAVGVVVVAALQDPRKDVLPQRSLFPVRVALRLVEDTDIDLALGKGARERGAACTSIPTGPAGSGVGYAWCDGEAEPTRIRLAWVSDDDIREAVERYAPHRDATGTREGVPA